MDPEKEAGNTGIKLKDITQWKGAYGKTTYVYQQPNASVIIIDDVEAIQEIREFKDMEKRKKDEGVPSYHLKGRVPTNLSKAEKQFKEKQEKEIIANKAHKTTISRDVIPSQIYNGTFEECFICIDKAVEINALKTAKEDLKRHYERKLQQKQKEVDIIRKQFQQSQEEYKKLQRQAKQAELETISLQERFMMQQEELKQLKKRLSQYEKRQIVPAELDMQFIAEIKKKQIVFHEKISALQQENWELKERTSSQEAEMDRLKCRISEFNPQVSPMKKKGSYLLRNSQEEISQENRDSREMVFSRISAGSAGDDDDFITMPY